MEYSSPGLAVSGTTLQALISFWVKSLVNSGIRKATANVSADIGGGFLTKEKENKGESEVLVNFFNWNKRNGVGL